jgi:hypothetical protein
MSYQTNKVLEELKKTDRKRFEYILWSANLTIAERDIVRLTILEGIPVKYLSNEIIMQSYGLTPLWAAEVTLYKKRQSGVNKIFQYLTQRKSKCKHTAQEQLELF